MRLRLGTRVHRIDRADGGWALALDQGRLTAAHAVIATGPDAEPVLPSWPGMDSFGGVVIHAGRFRNVAEVAGLDVLVVGPGNSGVDLLGYLAGSDAGQLWLSARSGMNITPRRLGGVPLHPVSVTARYLPLRWQDATARAAQRLAFGDLSRFGYPRLRARRLHPAGRRGRHDRGGRRLCPRAEDRTGGHEAGHRPVRRPAGPLHRPAPAALPARSSARPATVPGSSRWPATWSRWTGQGMPPFTGAGARRRSTRACGSSAWTAASTATCTSTAARRASWLAPSHVSPAG